MKRSLLLVTFVCLCTFGLAQQDAPTLSTQDKGAAEHVFQNRISIWLNLRHETLKSTSNFVAPGVPGYAYAPQFEVGATPFTGHDEKDSALLLGRDACYSKLVAVAQAGPSASYFISGERAIVTVYQFTIQRLLQGTASVGSAITAIEFGGTIHENGMTYRVILRGAEPYNMGEQYLIFLQKSADYPSEAHFLEGRRAKVSGDSIVATSALPRDGLIPNPIHPGETVDSFAARLAEAREAFPAQATPMGACSE